MTEQHSRSLSSRGRQWLSPLKDKMKGRFSRSRNASPAEGGGTASAQSEIAKKQNETTAEGYADGGFAAMEGTAKKAGEEGGAALQPVQQIWDHGTGNNIGSAGIVNTGVNYGHIEIKMDDARIDFTQLSDLPTQADLSGHLSDYFPESRIEDERHISHWLDGDGQQELVLCVLGKAGIGKTTFAGHLSERLRENNRLAAAIFFGFASPQWGVESIIKLISHQLGRAHPRAVAFISHAIRLHSGPSVPIITQIEKFILDPIRSLQYGRPLVVVLDALDQWDLYPKLAKALESLAPHSSLIRFIASGRPGLEKAFQSGRSSSYELPAVAKDVLEEYVKARFELIHWRFGRKPDAQAITRLIKKAEGLFLWIATVCSLLEDEMNHPDPHETLTSILLSRYSTGGSEGMGSIYHSAIERAFPKPSHKDKLRVYLGAILVLQEPIPLPDFARLVGMDVVAVKKIQTDLTGLRVGGTGNSPDTVYPAASMFHLSFLEYLKSVDVPSDLAFPIDPTPSHFQLGQTCLQELQRLSFHPLAGILPPLHRYVVKYWPVHTADGTPTVTPESDSDWKKTPHFAILDGLPVTQGVEWASLFLPLIDHASSFVPRDLYGSFGDVVLSLAQFLDNGHPSPYAVAVAGVAVRLHHSTANAWECLGSICLGIARTYSSKDLLDRAVMAARCVVHLLGSDEEIRMPSTRQLALSLLSRYEQFGNREDLDESIQLHRKALERLPRDDPSYSRLLNNLASALTNLFASTGALEFMEETLALEREALALAPKGQLDRLLSLNNLANSLVFQFKTTGSIELLDEALALDKEAHDLIPPGHPVSSVVRIDHTYADALLCKFESTGVVQFLTESIGLLRQALSLCPPGHPERGRCLNYLSWALLSQYHATGGQPETSSDLEQSISMAREAAELTPVSDPNYGACVDTLAMALRHKPERLDEALSFSRQAVDHSPGSCEIVKNLSTILLACHRRTRDISQLEEAISACQKALMMCPPHERSKLEAMEAEMLELQSGLDSGPDV